MVGTLDVSYMACVLALEEVVLIMASWKGEMLEVTVMFSSGYPATVCRSQQRKMRRKAQRSKKKSSGIDVRWVYCVWA